MVLRLLIFMVIVIFAMPAQANFDDLRDALEHRLNEVNREIDRQDEGDQFPLITFSKTLLKEGDTDPNLPLVRAKLIEYMPFEVVASDPYIYDAELVSAVKKFQRQMGMKDDGVIGPQTLSVLNRTLEDEKKQIEVNLHRLDQVEWQDRPDLRIDVDLARYHLSAYEDGDLAFDMPVVVGSKKRQTNLFSTVMTGVRLNPGWTLPPTIKEEDYIPKLRENPQWVSDQGVYIYASWDRAAEPIDPTTIDWNYLTDNEIKAMRFYKNAGDANPLGLYRFLMHNEHDIYLHDTNQKYLFNRAARAKSSGCVRVSDPRKIAEFLLKDNPDWTAERLDEVLLEGETYNVGAKRSIPVYFDYKTAWLNGGKTLVLGHDIYDLDDIYYRDIIQGEGSRTDSVEKILVE